MPVPDCRGIQAKIAQGCQGSTEGAPQRGSRSYLDLFFGLQLPGITSDLSVPTFKPSEMSLKDVLPAACFFHHRTRCVVWILGSLGQKQFLLHHCLRIFARPAVMIC